MANGNLAGPALLLVGTRVLNMGVGLLMVPLLIHALGGRGFAVWAVLLGCAAVFAELELGMPVALIRSIAVPLQGSPSDEASRTFSTVAVTVGAVYLGLLPLLVVAAPALGEWLRLPATPMFSGGQLVALVFVACGVRAVLQLGNYALVAARAFNLVAAFSLLQPFVSNLGAIVAASLSRRVDIALLWFWILQIAVVSVGFGMATVRIGLWQGPRRFLPGQGWWSLVRYGFVVQASDWAYTLTFHLNKVLIVRSLGLAGVSGYEVANRGALALRSIPAAGVETFLPSATIETARGLKSEEQVSPMITLTLYGTLVFLCAPAAVAPILLYGWVGELGFVSRWVFVGLIVAAATSLLAMPFAVMAQAAGRPIIQARAALTTVVLSLGLGSVFVHRHGAEGVALATVVASAVGAVLLIIEVHRALGLRVARTLGRTIVTRWPAIAACLTCGVAFHSTFRHWLEATPLVARYTVSARITGLLICGCLYLLCLAAMATAQGLLKGFTEDERALLARVRARLPWVPRPAAES